MGYSAAITFAWKSLQLKHAQMKIWLRDSSINIHSLCWLMDVGAQTQKKKKKNHTIIPSVPGENDEDLEHGRLVISDGISEPSEEYLGVTCKHWFLTGSQQIDPPSEVVGLSKQKSSGNQCRAFCLHSFHCNGEPQRVDGGTVGGRVTRVPPAASSAAN